VVVREHIVEPVVELAVDMVHLNGRDDHHGLQLLLACVSSTSTEKRRPEFLNAILGRGIIN